MRDIIVHPDPKRDARARDLVPQVARWPKHTLKVQWGAFDAGTVFRRVPSCTTDDTRYLANAVVCQCPDYQRAGNVCKHIRAIRLDAEQAREAAVIKPRARYEDIFVGAGDSLADAF